MQHNPLSPRASSSRLATGKGRANTPSTNTSSSASSIASGSTTNSRPGTPRSRAEGGNGHRHQRQESGVPTRLDLHLLPNPPQPSHLTPYLSPSSPLSPSEKHHLLTSIYLRACSSGNADTLEWLLALPPDPALTTRENAAAARRYSLTAVQMANGLLGLGGGGGGGGPAGEEGRKLPDEAPRKWVDLEATDEEGNTALGLCVALGHAEAVRVLVENGARVNQGDRVGWTPLHWAVQNNDIPIASYLLNHRASPLLASHKGLTPRDLVREKGAEGRAMKEVLQMAWEAAVEREREQRRREESVEEEEEGEEMDGEEQGGNGERASRPASRLSVLSIPDVGVGGGSYLDEKERRELEEQEREKERDKEVKRRVVLGMESATNLEVDMGVLGLGEGEGKTALEDDSPSDEDEGIKHPFLWSRCLPDQMLVYSLSDLPTLFDVIITTIKPVRARRYRVIPANVLFLCARFAANWGSEEMLEELMIGAMERIEMAVHDRPDDMANCAFWLSNSLLLLYYLRKDATLLSSLSRTTYQLHLCDLINEIFVFIIRDAERRIDRLLESALLEHEALPGFEDVAFEDEWAGTRFVKKLTGRSKKALGGGGGGPGGGGMRSSVSARNLFSAAGTSGSDDVLLGNGSSSSSGGGGFEGLGVGGGGLAGLGGKRGVSVGSPPPRQRMVSASQIPPSEATPRSITALLSSTLFVLQIYEIPPSIVVQAFSQLFYWIACEVFNRLLTQRKFLCRSRAMQIRLNASNLEDWARSNRLPTKMVSVHFTPLNQLLQWLQCLSSESSIDGLIGTVQSLRALNPLQLRRAVREYRYEVDESRMDDDCAQYLVQIQKQWERLRMAKRVGGLGVDGTAAAEGEEQSGKPSPAGGSGAVTPKEKEKDDAAAQEDVARMIDEVFSDPSSFGSYTPPGGAEALGELLNSRYMLPFAVPSSAEMLVNFAQPDAFGPFAHSRQHLPPRSEGTTTPRSSSRLSLSSMSRPSFHPTTSATTITTADDAASIFSFSTDASRPPLPSSESIKDREPFTPVLPDDFFAVWDAAKEKAGQRLPPSTSATLLAEVERWDVSPAAGGWSEWREGVESGGEGSVVDHQELEGERSFESSGSVEELVDETPRQRTGFQP